MGDRSTSSARRRPPTQADLTARREWTRGYSPADNNNRDHSLGRRYPSTRGDRPPSRPRNVSPPERSTSNMRNMRSESPYTRAGGVQHATPQSAARYPPPHVPPATPHVPPVTEQRNGGGGGGGGGGGSSATAATSSWAEAAGAKSTLVRRVSCSRFLTKWDREQMAKIVKSAGTDVVTFHGTLRGASTCEKEDIFVTKPGDETKQLKQALKRGLVIIDMATDGDKFCDLLQVPRQMLEVAAGPAPMTAEELRMTAEEIEAQEWTRTHSHTGDPNKYVGPKRRTPDRMSPGAGGLVPPLDLFNNNNLTPGDTKNTVHDAASIAPSATIGPDSAKASGDIGPAQRRSSLPGGGGAASEYHPLAQASNSPTLFHRSLDEVLAGGGKAHTSPTAAAGAHQDDPYLQSDVCVTVAKLCLGDQVRRWRIDGLGFEELRARVKNSFDVHGDFGLRFTDSEGDECEMAFAEEWSDAIEDCRDSVLRLDVVTTESRPSLSITSGASPWTLHAGLALCVGLSATLVAQVVAQLG